MHAAFKGFIKQADILRKISGFGFQFLLQDFSKPSSTRVIQARGVCVILSVNMAPCLLECCSNTNMPEEFDKFGHYGKFRIAAQ
ncbi:hypothetical protein [Methylophilus sp. 3sh_L]|uniref:hypothetical protein n=1 Tax=Methylophilus sp. 3sh_L TaxID=3377114 RepID=UPI00398EE537